MSTSSAPLSAPRRSRLAALASDRSGNVAVMFALAVMPAMALVGAGIDYGKAVGARGRLQAASDSAVLALATEPGLAQSALDTKADQIVRGVLAATPWVSVDRVRAVKEGSKFTVTATAHTPNTFGGVVGLDRIPFDAKATAESAGKPIEVALVLDTTGSMNSSGKLAALKQSARNFLAFLDASVVSRDQAKVALVPFATQVNIGTTVKSATWLSYDSSGSTLGASHKTTASTWTGCITDRNTPHNTELPTTTTGTARYWADVCDAANQTKVVALGTDYHALGQSIDNIVANGYTNIGIGMAWGMEALTPGGPLAASTALGSKDVDKIVILLTDGDNTQDRYDSYEPRVCYWGLFCTADKTANLARLNARTLANCTAAKNAGIRVYTVRLIEGDANLLRSCASENSFFYDVLKAEDLAPAFKSIGAAIMAVRITK